MDKIVITNTSSLSVGNFRLGSWMNPWWNSTVSLNAQARQTEGGVGGQEGMLGMCGTCMHVGDVASACASQLH